MRYGENDGEPVNCGSHGRRSLSKVGDSTPSVTCLPGHVFLWVHYFDSATCAVESYTTQKGLQRS